MYFLKRDIPTACINLKNVMLGDRSQTQKMAYKEFHLKEMPRKNKLMETESSRLVDAWEQGEEGIPSGHERTFWD